MRISRGLVLLFLLVLLMSGCMYPGDSREFASSATGEYAVLVENAVITFKERTGVLPIYNSTETTPIYEKYRIDFQKLLDYRVLSEVPRDAYEEGGSYYYMIVDPEGEIRIKLMDLRVSQKIADLQRLVNHYRREEGVWPHGKPAAPHFYTLDFRKLGRRQEQIKSVYSETYLSYLLHDSGVVAIEYAPEIMKALSKQGNVEQADSEDLRSLLVEQTPLIPVGSYPYHLENGMPVIAER